MLHLKTWASVQTHIPFRTLEFNSWFFVYSGTHMGPSSLPFQRLVFFCVLSQVCSFSCWMGLCFFSSGLSIRHPPCINKTIENGKFQSLENSFLVPLGASSCSQICSMSINCPTRCDYEQFFIFL